MSKLNHQQIADEVSSKGYELIDDDKYANMNSPIIVRCKRGHLIETCLKDFRHVSFVCPKCDCNINFVNPNAVPEKTGTRIIAFDQATENFGLSIFDNGKLVFYQLYKFDGLVVNRLVKIRKFIDEIVIDRWQPDVIYCEDIQYQNANIMTYKILAMLLGNIQELCCEKGIECNVVSPNVWRKYAGTAGKDRKQEKALSVAVVKQKYGVQVTDDIAEAILIGYYGTKIQREKPAFGEV